MIAAGIFLIASNGYDLTKKKDSAEFIKSFSGWAVRVGSNIGSSVGYVIRLDWIPR